jgi:hypothetical protein
MEGRVASPARSLTLVTATLVALVPAGTTRASATLLSVARTSDEFPYSPAPWNTGSRFGWTVPDSRLTWLPNGADTFASATVMNHAAWWQLGRYFSTNAAADTYTWVDIYRLTGTPDGSAAIRLDYEFTPSHLNYAIDGRSETWANVQLSYGITDADVSTVDKLLAYNDAFPAKASSGGWSDAKKYSLVCFTGGAERYTGTLDLGVLSAGEYLWLRGTNTAWAAAQVYGPGFSGAAALSPFEYTLGVTDLPGPVSPIPEPAALWLVLIGLAGLVRLCPRSALRIR